MKKYIEFIYKANKPIMIVFVLLNLLAIYGVTQLKLETSFDVFKTQDSEYISNMEVLEENFPSSDQIIVVTEYSDDIKGKLDGFESFAAELNGIKYVKGTESSIPVQAEELSAIKTVDGKEYATLVLFPNEDFNFSDLKSIEEYLKDDEIEYYIGGDKYMQNKIFDYLLFILLVIPPIILIILFTIFRIQMGSIKGTLLSVLPAGIAALWTLGFAGLIGNQVSILTVLAPIFTIIIGSADGLHFTSHVQEYLGEGSTMKESLTKSLKMVGVPMIITTVTSVAGFVALIFMKTSAVHDLAIFASIGITLAGIITWLIVPTINSMEKIDISRSKKARSIDIPFNKLFGWPSITIAVIIIATAFIGIPRINTEFNQLMMYKDYTEVSKSFDKIMEVNGGTIPMFALIENDGEPMSDEIKGNVEEYSAALLESGHVSKVVSIYSILDAVEENLPNKSMLAMIDFKSLDIYSELINDKYSKIVIYPTDLNNDTIENIINLSNEKGDILLAGTQFTMYELNQMMIQGQAISLIVAFALVFIFLISSLRKFSVSLFAMFPILLTTLFMFAFLGLTNISLNLFTTTIFSITIGVGIDYAIHYTSIYQEYKKEGKTSKEAVEEALRFSSRPIIANALGFAMALSALMISPLKVHMYVSSLMWVSMILSSFLSLSFLPTLLRKLK
ncbi:MAG: MMPL family transporter [Clostridia bacterium]|nr:MMPL family transporter [Clostridia bacterium]